MVASGTRSCGLLHAAVRGGRVRSAARSGAGTATWRSRGPARGRAVCPSRCGLNKGYHPGTGHQGRSYVASAAPMAAPPLTPAAVAIEKPSGHTERDTQHTDQPSLQPEELRDPGAAEKNPLAAEAGRPKGSGCASQDVLVYRGSKRADRVPTRCSSDPGSNFAALETATGRQSVRYAERRSHHLFLTDSSLCAATPRSYPHVNALEWTVTPPSR